MSGQGKVRAKRPAWKRWWPLGVWAGCSLALVLGVVFFHPVRNFVLDRPGDEDVRVRLTRAGFTVDSAYYREGWDGLFVEAHKSHLYHSLHISTRGRDRVYCEVFDAPAGKRPTPKPIDEVLSDRGELGSLQWTRGGSTKKVVSPRREGDVALAMTLAEVEFAEILAALR